ncbi:efflux transporter outer membrane subunit [Marinobacter nanhaiticus D15-8W]|uniref:TolC family protein n=2 Tax=Marinobacter TaxID=2742 RepID=N6VZE4_9GAMM|nr:TolC family protein [Marinobacter nanhaiticus D15-8W]BES70596.1 efflux transporter outer membrane subunit [Marinobacter nanhaiticus D15-8W]
MLLMMSGRSLLAAAITVLLAGCATTPTESLPTEPPLPSTFADTASGMPPSEGWWTHFDDPRLNAVVGAAVSDNFSLVAARERLRQANAAARIAGADALPALDGSGDARVSREEGSNAESYSVGVVASYEVDLWGRIDATIESAELEAGATRADLQAAYISLTAETADTYYSLLLQRAIVDLLEQQRTTNQQVADLIRVRYRNGQAQLDEYLRQQRLTEASTADLLSARATLEEQRNQLAALLGRPAEALELPEGHEITQLPPIPAVGIPAEWLQRRPDLQAAWLRVRAADADTAAAIANQYPRLDLSASLETAATSPSNLFEDWVSSLATSLTVPLFRGGALRAEVERSQAARAVAFNEYAQNVVDAVAEVEIALSNARYDRNRLESLNRQLELAEAVVDRLRGRYLSGATEYLDVLSALTTLQDVQRQQLEARWALLLDRIALIRTIAGGWNTGESEASENS